MYVNCRRCGTRNEDTFRSTCRNCGARLEEDDVLDTLMPMMQGDNTTVQPQTRVTETHWSNRENKISISNHKTCIRCRTKNAMDAEYCSRCGADISL